jgi:hypothetical protein
MKVWRLNFISCSGGKRNSSGRDTLRQITLRASGPAGVMGSR